MRIALVFTLVALAIALAAPTAEGQQSERLEFKGIPLESTQAQFVERFPLVQCGKQKDLRIADISCVGVREIACNSAQTPSVRSCLDQRAKDYSYGGVEVDAVLAHFYSDALVSLSVRFKSSAFDQVLQAIATRYGKPDNLKTERLETRAGATYENIVASWKKKGSTLEARKYSGDINTAQASYRLDSSIHEFMRREKQSARKGAGDL
jgi:hypothetical protein